MYLYYTQVLTGIVHDTLIIKTSFIWTLGYHILLRGNLRDIGSLVYCSFVTASMTCYLLLFSVEGVSCFSNSTAVVETTEKLCIT